MKRILTFFFTLSTLTIFSQTPTWNIGTDCGGGSGYTYTNNLMTDKGAFWQRRIQENFSTSAGSRKWEFNADGYFNTWRAPSSANIQIAGHNQTIAPSSTTASAFFRNNFGGGDGARMRATTSGNYYTFNISENRSSGNAYISQYMSILETSYVPVTINSVTRTPSGTVNANVQVTITITTSASVSTGEFVYVRYTTNNYASSTIVQANMVGSSGSAVIPGFAQGTTVNYYVYTSPSTSSTINSDVTTHGQVAHDMQTLELSSGGSYVVDVTLSTDLVSLEAKRNSSRNLISWTTATELNSNHFVVEKSTDGSSFVELGKVIGAGTSNKTKNYQFIDENPAKGINYYRLKSVDNVGKESLSRVVSVNFDGKTDKPKVYPNPARDAVTVDYESANNDLIDVQILDVSGRVVLKQQFDVAEGTNNLPLNTQNLAKGYYFVKINDKTSQFVKQ